MKVFRKKYVGGSEKNIPYKKIIRTPTDAEFQEIFKNPHKLDEYISPKGRNKQGIPNAIEVYTPIGTFIVDTSIYGSEIPADGVALNDVKFIQKTRNNSGEILRNLKYVAPKTISAIVNRIMDQIITNYHPERFYLGGSETDVQEIYNYVRREVELYNEDVKEDYLRLINRRL